MNTVAADTEPLAPPPIPSWWNRRHLLATESLSAEEITVILDTAEQFKQITEQGRQKLSILSGQVVANMFFEDSTRTRTSFGLAANRLGADLVQFASASSSLSKGETLIDTAKTIEAMNVDVMVVRHRTPGTPHLPELKESKQG